MSIESLSLATIDQFLAVESKVNDRLLITTENTVEIECQPKPALIANVLTLAVLE